VRPGLVSFLRAGTTVRVEIVSTPSEMSRGLMDRASLAQDCGMLFNFGWRGAHVFYMRRTRIPLDLIYLDGNTVVGGLTMTPFDETPRGIVSPSTSVLEVNGGWIARHGIEIEDLVTVSV
jgi:uncharacterized protein